SVFYLHPGQRSWAAIVGSALLVGAITAMSVMQARRRPYLVVGWLWFLGALVPTIGLLQAHVQAMADRFVYMPLIGILITVVWGTVDWTARWSHPQVLNTSLAATVLAGCMVMTSLQLRYWQNSVSLLQRAVQVEPGNFL